MSSVALVSSDSYEFQDAMSAKYGTRIGPLSQSVYIVNPNTGVGDGMVAGRVIGFQSTIDSATSTPTYRLEFEGTVDMQASTADIAKASVQAKLGIRAGALNRLYGTFNDRFSGANIEIAERSADTIDMKLAITDSKRLNTIMSGAGRLSQFSSNSAGAISNPVSGNATSADPEDSRGFNTSFVGIVLGAVAGTAGRFIVSYRMIVNEASTACISAIALHSSPTALLGPGSWNIDLTLGDPVPALFEVPLETTTASDGNDWVLGTVFTNVKHQLVFHTSIPNPYVPVPKSVVWHVPVWSELQAFAQTVNVADTTTHTTVNLANMNMAVIPSMYCIFTELLNAKTPSAPNTRYGVANRLSIEPAGMAPSLITYSARDLYDMSARNGLRYSYAAFTAALRSAVGAEGVGVGSMVFFRPSDLNLPPKYTSNAMVPLNMRGEYRFTMPADLLSQSVNTVTKVFALQDFKLQCDREASSTARYSYRRIALSPTDILAKATEEDGVSFRDVDLSGQRVGGSWFSDLFESGKKAVSDGWKWLSSDAGRDAIRHLRSTPGISAVAGPGTTVGAVADAVGYGAPMGGRADHLGGGVWSPDMIARSAHA